MADTQSMPDETNPETTEGAGIIDTVTENVAEVPEGVLVGTGKFGAEAADFVDGATLGVTDKISRWMNENIADLGHIIIDDNNALVYARGVEAAMREAERMGLEEETPEHKQFVLDLVDKKYLTDGLQTTGGNIASDITRLGLGYLTTRGVTSKVVKPTTTRGKVIKGYGDLTAAEMLAFDKHEERLSNFIETYPATQNIITDFLKADPNDEGAEAYAKQALEALALEGIVGGTIGSVLMTAKAIRKVESRVVTQAEEAVVSQQNFMQYETFEEGLVAWRNANQTVDARYVEAEELTGSARQQARAAGRAEGIDLMTGGQQKTIQDFGGGQTIPREVQIKDAEEFVTELLKDSSSTTDEMADYIASVKNLPEDARLALNRASQLQKHSVDVYIETFKKVQTGEATTDDLMKALRSTIEITAFVHGGVANAARSVNMAKEFDNLSTPTMKAILDASKEITDNPSALRRFFGGVAKYIPDLAKQPVQKATDMLNELFINSILSGVKTHTVNLMGNTFMTAYTPIIKASGAVMRGDKDELIKSGMLYVGAVKGIFESAKMASVALYRNKTLLDSTQNTIEEGMNTGAIPNWMGGGIVRLPTRLLSASDEFYKQLNFRSMLTATLDQEARALNLKGAEKKAWIKKSFDNAVAEQLNASLTGTKSHNPYVKKALDYARDQTFTQSLKGGVPQVVQESVRGVPILRQVFPFVRTPTNLISNVAQNSPVAPLSRRFRDDIKAGGQVRAEALAKMTIGTALSLYLFNFSDEETFTGSGVGLEYEDMDNLAEMTGYMPNAVYSKDEGVYRDMSRLSPATDLITITASMRELTKYGMYDEASQLAQGLTMIFAQHADDPNFARSAEALLNYGGDLAGGAAIVGVEYLRDRTYLQGVDDIAKMMEDPDGSVGKFLTQRVGALVPYSGLLKQLNGDPYLRDLTTMSQQFMQHLPTPENLSKRNSEAYDPRRNILSEVLPKSEFWGYTDDGFVEFLSPIKESEEKKDPLAEAWREQAKTGVPFKIRDLPKNKDTFDLRNPNFNVNPNRPNQTAYDQWHELVGEVQVLFKPTSRRYGQPRKLGLREMLEQVVQLDGFKEGRELTFPIGENHVLKGSKEKLISDVISHYRSLAFEQLVGKNPFTNVNEETNSLFLDQFDDNNFITSVRGAKNQKLAIAYWTKQYVNKGVGFTPRNEAFFNWFNNAENKKRIRNTILGDFE